MTLSTRHLRIHRFAALDKGPRLVVTGAVHGNETAGTRGIERVVREIERGEIDIVRGTLTFVPVCNPLAYRHRRRAGERNLNRRLLPGQPPQPGRETREYEDQVADVLCPLLAEHDVLLDLHSFRSPGEPFALRGPQDNAGALEPFAHAAAEARLAAHLGVRRIVDGWLDAYARGVAQRKQRGLTPGAVNEDAAYGIGTTEYMRSVGGYAVTLECGQHDDPAAPGVAYHAIRQTLALLGLVEGMPAPPAGPFECLTLARVIDRHAEGDRFVKTWTSFDALAKGDLIALRADGSEVRAPEAGCIVFPDHGALPGHEWFYLGQPSPRGL
ncbi:MAG: succinylglutamate desuccinylase/aspartoacylase family protein [Rubrivivax sp.]|nr:succinylglutamate desuccinylase/aspartoacylase family protein [Rubrivivax sp.]